MSFRVYRTKRRLVGARCPNCGNKIDGATGVSPDALEPEIALGSVAICLFCGQINIYEGDARFRPATAREVREMELSPHTALALKAARKAVAEWRATHGKAN